MKRKNIDWDNLSFDYQKTDFRFVAYYENGEWLEKGLIQDEFVHLPEGSGALHYAQQCFESLKVYTTSEDKILLFRPLDHLKRLQQSSQRLMMPEVPKQLFFQAIEKTVLANSAWIPPFESKASLYIRTILFGSGKMLGLVPAPRYEFRVFVSPIGDYFSHPKKEFKLYLVRDYDKRSPRGIGFLKAGSNYAAGFFLQKRLQEKGADDAIFLDPLENRYLEDTRVSNILIFTKNQVLLVPPLDSSFPGITKSSILHLAKHKLGFKVEQRRIDFFAEVENFAEMAVCGTGTTLMPVSEIITDNKKYSLEKNSPNIQKIYQELFAIQRGLKVDSYGWHYNILSK